VAQVAGPSFEKYYASFMPGIKQILTTATSQEMRLVRFKAMECAGVVCDAVGVSVFAADAVELMTFFARAIVSTALELRLFHPLTVNAMEISNRKRIRTTSSRSTTRSLRARA
jgi:hypothetical protein